MTLSFARRFCFLTLSDDRHTVQTGVLTTHLDTTKIEERVTRQSNNSPGDKNETVDPNAI
ncbi:conserved protein of unknown function [Ectopseudomonas oleovorans]|uniref:Uncharacterized protein n=1 Tax=Ectopseudomonas oleovorans TaxID=301 RepID=A0A653AXU5_ECTOL|nr:conserved protein of unknown function [Pseudomonas oleovorans]